MACLLSVLRTCSRVSVFYPMRKIGQRFLRNMFGLDYRSLALLRMGLAVALLMTLRECGEYLGAFYTDAGALPRAALIANNYAPPWPNVHMAGGSFAFQAALFGLQVVLALLLLVGYRTRLVTALSFYLLFSMQGRNPMLIFGPDMMLRLMLFWGIFLPLGRRFSLDAELGRTPPPAEPVYFDIAGVAYILQFILIYFYSGYTKTGATWQVDHTAIARALDLEIFRRPLGHWINHYDWLTTWLTVAVPPIETYGAFLFIVPFCTGWARWAGFLLLTGLQLGFNLSMDLGLFGVVMVAIMLGLLPAECWTGLLEPLGRKIARWRPGGKTKPPRSWLAAQARARGAAERRAAWRARHKGLVSALRWLRRGLVAFLVYYIVGWNVDYSHSDHAWVPVSLDGLAYNFGFEQHFDNLFAPNPEDQDGWFILSGTTVGDREVNVFSGAEAFTLARPASVVATYRGERWGSYLPYVLESRTTWLLEPLALYLGREWNRTHFGADRVKSIQINFMLERVGAHHTKTPTQMLPLWAEPIRSGN